jgi:hypothetical protein
VGGALSRGRAAARHRGRRPGRGRVAGQLAPATRDPELLGLADELHRETLTRIKWLKTQVEQASPQALVVGAGT